MYYINEDRKLLLGALLFLLLISLQAVVAFGEESKDVQIFEVRKKLQMTASDPIVRDYYVNAGQLVGLKQGASVNVFRKVPLADPFKQETQAHVELPVGVMKVIYSDRTMAIGRIQNLRPSKDSPVLDGDIFMVGDRVDLGTINFEKSASEDKGESDTKSAGKSSNDEEAEVPQKAEAEDIQKPAKKPSRTSASTTPVKPKETGKTEHKTAKSLEPEAKTVEILSR